MAKANRKQYVPVAYDANTVWAAACAAQRINGEYLKEAKWIPDTNVSVPANKVLMRTIISDPAQITAEDRAQAELVRTYWRNKLVEVLAGTANQFTAQAVDFAGRTEILSNEFLALGTISYLPEGYNRGQKRDEQRMKKQEATMGSQHFGKVGDKISSKATVIECRYSERWGTHYVTAQFDTNVILFAYRNKLEDGVTITLTGTIKAHRDDGITQLNRVRIIGDSK
jgi:hypothetical protein